MCFQFNSHLLILKSPLCWWNPNTLGPFIICRLLIHSPFFSTWYSRKLANSIQRQSHVSTENCQFTHGFACCHGKLNTLGFLFHGKSSTVSMGSSYGDFQSIGVPQSSSILVGFAIRNHPAIGLVFVNGKIPGKIPSMIKIGVALWIGSFAIDFFTAGLPGLQGVQDGRLCSPKGHLTGQPRIRSLAAQA